MIKEFYQKVKNENNQKMRVIDYDRILKKDCHINIILSERYRQGKTTSAMEFILDKWLKYKSKSIFMFNIEAQFKNNIHKLLQANRIIYRKKWAKVKITYMGLFLDDELFCYFVSLGSYLKFKSGTRDVGIKYLFYDEFNEGLNRIGAKQPQYFNNILHSCNKNIRCLIFGNRVSIGVPLLQSFNIYEIKKELEIKNIGNMKILFYVPFTDKKQQVEITKEKNWIYDYSKQVGEYDKDILNLTDYDNYEGVVPQSQKTLWKIHTENVYLKLRAIYLKIWIKGNYFYLERVEKPPNNVEIITRWRGLVDHNIKLSLEYFNHLKDKLGWGLIYFDSMITKIEFIKDL